MTNQGRASNIHATIGPHPQVKCNDIITDVKTAIDEAESRGRAEVQAQLDEVIRLLNRLRFEGRLDVPGREYVDDWLSVYDARAAAKKGG